jgi:hypothetical protein
MTPPDQRKERLLRDAGVVAMNEWQDALRSRRGLVVLLLFLAGAVGGILMAISFIHSIERNLAKALVLEPTDGTGSMTATLWQNQSFRSTVTDLVDDPDLAEALLSAPPLSLFFCGIVFFLTPMLVAMTSSHRLTEDIWSGASRFVLYRTSRLAWCLGKFAGQAGVLLVALMISVPAAWLCGWIRMDDFPVWATLVSMSIFAVKAWIYALSFLGLVSGLSLFVRNPGVATAIGVLGLAALSVVYHVAGHYSGEGWWILLELPRFLTPYAYHVDLLRPDWRHMLPSIITLLTLSLAYLLAGYAHLARRDV